MDPNATLTEIRHLVARLRDEQNPPRMADRLEMADRLAELFAALDGWLSGPAWGFLPHAWGGGSRDHGLGDA